MILFQGILEVLLLLTTQFEKQFFVSKPITLDIFSNKDGIFSIDKSVTPNLVILKN